MSYEPDLTPAAVEDLQKLPLPVALFVETQLNRLAANPTELSRPSHFPYLVDGQSFRFEHESEGVRYFFHVLFKYGQDEKTIHILQIANQQYRIP